MQSITFKNRAWQTAANILFPAEFDSSKKYPAIISVHPIGSCKEQTSGNIYGKALAEAGFVVLVIDASFQGDSDGEPRFIEDPTQRVEDIRYAVDYLVTLDYVDEQRIGVLGVCGGGAYSLNAAMTERRLKAVVSITGVNFGRLLRESFSGGSPLSMLEQVAAQRTAEARGQAVLVNNLLPDSVAAAKQAGIADIDILEATDYYKTPRGQQPHGATSALFSHLGVGLGWDAFHLAEVLLTQPILVVIGNKPGGFGAYCDGHEIVRRAASPNKTLLELDGVSHYDLYDQPQAVGQALAKVIPFFQENI